MNIGFGKMNLFNITHAAAALIGLASNAAIGVHRFKVALAMAGGSRLPPDTKMRGEAVP
jgi:hypothetical protein